MGEWAGLGYYARARNLLKCARVVVSDHGGRFPDTRDGLLGLPGVGPYTAAAVAAYCYCYFYDYLFIDIIVCVIHMMSITIIITTMVISTYYYDSVHWQYY